MITLTREEAQQVLDGLRGDNLYAAKQARETLRARLSAPEPEPVAWAWGVNSGAGYYTRGVGFDKTDIPFAKHIPLYTAPPQREWQGLTYQEIKEILDCGRSNLINIKKAEQKLKEKNT
jgi:hypothetical protein